MTISETTAFTTLAIIGPSTLKLAGMVLGLIILLAAGFVVALPWIVQPFLRMVLFLRYDIRRIGLENVPGKGPVFLASNHLSWFDGFFLAASFPRRGTALMNEAIFSWPVVGYLSRRCGLISVPYTGPKALRASIEACRQVLDEGSALAIFPEGQLSRTGMTGKFQRGLEVILTHREHVPVIPVYLDNVWGSIMSYSDRCFVKKWPKGWRRTIVVAFGPPVETPVTAFKVRQAVLVQGVKARAALGFKPELPEPIDSSLPHFVHPSFGPLTGSAANIHAREINVHQIGEKPGTVGLALPGVAIRAVDDAGEALPPDSEGRLQALVTAQPDWVDIGHRGKIDGDGFVTISDGDIGREVLPN